MTPLPHRISFNQNRIKMRLQILINLMDIAAKVNFMNRLLNPLNLNLASRPKFKIKMAVEYKNLRTMINKL